MSQYISIKNPGVAPVESFTTLGLSTSAESNVSGLIGQFGSGNKHAINLLLRNHKSVVAYLGETRLEFGSVLKTVHAPDGSHVYDQATMSVDGVEQELGHTVSFGKFDWDDVTMALREFISNAIDMTLKLHDTHQHSDLRIGTCADPVSVPNCTTVYVEADDALLKYVREIEKYFLHFSSVSLEDCHIPQEPGSNCRIYREGVYVRELDEESIFSYNFPSTTIAIDECRNLDKYSAERLIRDELSDFTHVEAAKVLEKVKSRSSCLEATVLGDNYALTYRKVGAWEKAVKDTFSPDDVLMVGNPYVERRVIEEGYTPVCVSSDMLKVLQCQGAQTYKDILDAESQCEYELVDGDPMDVIIAEKIWDGLCNLGIASSDAMPSIKYFRDPEDDKASRKLGYVKEGIVFINECLRGDSTMLRATFIEEYIHILSNCSDCTRGFQTFACETISTALVALEVHDD